MSLSTQKSAKPFETAAGVLTLGQKLGSTLIIGLYDPRTDKNVRRLPQPARP